MAELPRALDVVGKRALSAVLALAIGAALGGKARADTDHGPPRPARVEWNDDWARFRPWEYAATGAAWTAALIVRFAVPVNRSTGTFGVDEQLVDALSLSGTAGDVAATIADIGYIGSIAYRLVDSTVVPGLVWGSGDVALQMTLIDLQAFGFASVILFTAQMAYGRERPLYRNCPESAAQGVECDDQGEDRYRSFIAGHTLTATTAAGLTCVHHAHLPLYGGGVADDVACAAMIGMAVAVGVGRITVQKHYTTDTLIGWGLGVLAGFVVPSALHYGFGSAASERPATARRTSASGSLRVLFIPGAASSPAGATLTGIF